MLSVIFYLNIFLEIKVPKNKISFIENIFNRVSDKKRKKKYELFSNRIRAVLSFQIDRKLMS
jgi:hypothetical protein